MKSMAIKAAVLVFAVMCFSSIARAGKDAGQSLRKAFPNLKFESITPSPIAGLYEVTAGKNIAYFAPGEDILILGQMIDSKGRNITAERSNELVARMARDLPLDKAVKRGNGPHKVIEFTDPDCPFCRKAAAFFDSRSDVTRYTFFLPLPVHPDAENKVRYVLCADERGPVLDEVMKGKIDGRKYKTCESTEVDDLVRLHKSLAAGLGISSTPFFIVDGVAVSGIDTVKITQLLSKSRN